METQTNGNNVNPDGYPMKSLGNVKVFENTKDFKNDFRQMRFFNLDDLLEKLGISEGKKSFLVFKNNRYSNVLTENIALFYIKYKAESSVLMCFDKQEYFVNTSLEKIQNSLSEKQFFRLNRQYLINFNAIKDVEYYLARTLLVNLAVPVKDKLLVSREKTSAFLHWLDNR